MTPHLVDDEGAMGRDQDLARLGQLTKHLHDFCDASGMQAVLGSFHQEEPRVVQMLQCGEPQEVEEAFAERLGGHDLAVRQLGLEHDVVVGDGRDQQVLRFVDVPKVWDETLAVQGEPKVVLFRRLFQVFGIRGGGSAMSKLC